MKIDYSALLRTDRLRPDLTVDGSLPTQADDDRSKVLSSPAFRRLQQHAQVFPASASINSRSKLSHALEASQVGRAIASDIAAHLERENLAGRTECAAFVTFAETACLTRDIGSPPFGRAGEAAIQRWFTDHGPASVRAACKTPGGRELDDSDPRLLNALSDFYEFDRNPQGLRVLAKLQWNNDPHGLNLSKASIAGYVQFGRMAGERIDDEHQQFSGKPGFFSTEAGLIKNIWSSFGYDTTPQRHPLSYIAAAAHDIVTDIRGLEEAIDANLLRANEAIQRIREAWLSNYIPVDPDPGDEQILGLLDDAIAGTNRAGDDFSFADFRRALISSLSQYAARHYLAQHEAMLAGATETLLPPMSGAGAIVAILKNYCQEQVYRSESAQQHELHGYTVIRNLLDQFGILLAAPQERFQLALDRIGAHAPIDNAVLIESKLLALIPTQYRNAYSNLTTQLGHARGRDEEFEEWNTRAHLVVDYIAGLTESAAGAMVRNLSGMPA